MAGHYGAAVILTRLRKPRDKAKVEAGVQAVERWVLARLRDRTFFGLGELDRAIREELLKLNERPFQQLDGCRRSLFESPDRPALRPLPAKRYEFAWWKKATVNIDYHIAVERNFYSVPHSLVRRKVEVRVTSGVVEVLHKGRRVASHRRVEGKGIYVTDPDHMPRAHRKHLEWTWTPSQLIRWAGTVGPSMAELVKTILKSRPHPEQGYRSCLGILRLARHYPPERMEAAARRALAFDALSYRSVKSILAKGLDKQPVEQRPEAPVAAHANIRGADYYREATTC